MLPTAIHAPNLKYAMTLDNNKPNMDLLHWLYPRRICNLQWALMDPSAFFVCATLGSQPRLILQKVHCIDIHAHPQEGRVDFDGRQGFALGSIDRGGIWGIKWHKSKYMLSLYSPAHRKSLGWWSPHLWWWALHVLVFMIIFNHVNHVINPVRSHPIHQSFGASYHPMSTAMRLYQMS